MLGKSSSASLRSAVEGDEYHVDESFLKIMEKKREVNNSEKAEGNAYFINFNMQQISLAQLTNITGKITSDCEVRNSSLWGGRNAYFIPYIRNRATQDSESESVSSFLISNNSTTMAHLKHHIIYEEVRGSSLEHHDENYSSYYEINNHLDIKENSENSGANHNQGHGSPLPGEVTALEQEKKSQGEIVRNGLLSMQLRLKKENMSDLPGRQFIKFDYQFRSWSGAHSVQVQIKAHHTRDVNITLLPSDVRVADALCENIGNIMRSIPHLSLPRPDGDESYQHQKDEEEKE